MDDAHSSLLPTQRPLSLTELSQVLAPLGAVEATRLLSGGTFSAVQAVTLSEGREVVVKTSVPIAALPDGRTPLLTYERDMLCSERDTLELVRGLEGVPAPRVLLADFSREAADVDVIAMDLIPGTPWDTVVDSMPRESNELAHEQVGAILASLHAVTAPRFGYPARNFELGGHTWPEFIDALMATVVADAEAWGVDIEPERLLSAVAKGREALAEITTPRLIHNDLWHGNVLLDPATGHVNGVVDFERALFADPLWDFVGAESMLTGASSPALLRGYEAAGGVLPWDASAGTVTGFDEAADTRTTLYRLWAMSVQLIEIVPRCFSGDWVAGHRATILANRAALLARAGV